MSDAGPAAIPPFSADETLRLADLSEQVLNARAPVSELLDVLNLLDREQNQAMVAAVFESVAWRVDVRHYWVYFRAAQAYSALGPSRDDAAYLTAAAALQMEPSWDGASQLFAILLRVLCARRRWRDAAQAFDQLLETVPEQLVSHLHDLSWVFAAAGLPMLGSDAAPPAPDSRRLHRVVPAETRAAWTCAVVGGNPPYGVRKLASEARRQAIDVAQLHDAQLLLSNNAVVTLDRNGALHEDLSVAEFPYHVRRKLDRLAARGDEVETLAVDEAVLVSDGHPPPNLCHFLLDQVSRLQLYRLAGVEIGGATVIGPALRTDFQRAIAARAGVSRWIGTDRLARVRVRRLWVSTNCRALQHAAHLGAEWAVSYLQGVLGGAGTRGWRRLYVSRGDVTARQVRNEAEVMAVLEPHGFEAIQPGRMSYEAQLAAFRQASHVIAPHGAALTHLIVCPPGTQVLEIFHPLYGTSAYAMQVRAAKLNYTAMVARDGVSDAPEWNDPALADVESARFLGRHMRIDLAVLQQYLDTVL